MTDDDVAALLAGVDAPRPLPPATRSGLEAELTGVAPRVGGAAPARPVPDDLRRRLEASLLEAPPLPRRLDRRLTSALVRPRPALVRLTAAAAALVVLAGLLVTTTRDGEDQHVATRTTEPGPAAGGPGAGQRPATDGSETALGEPPPPFVDVPPAAEGPAPGGGLAGGGGGGGGGEAGAGADSGGDGGPAAAPSTGSAGELRVALEGDDTVAARAFHAYLRLLNEAGGVNGRPVATVAPDEVGPGVVASVNLGAAPVASDGGGTPAWVGGVLFETMHVDDAPLRGAVTSLASPLEAQARLAVLEAFPDPALGRRAAVYVDAAAPWVDHVAPAFEGALRERGVTPLRVPFDGDASAFVAADAAFLALPPDGVAAWLAAASGRPPPPVGTWGVASAWDDAFVADAAAAALHVLSPYAPATGDELAALRTAIDRPLSSEAVHGWVTAKAIAYLLFENGGMVLDEASLDRLSGWPSSWSPPFETREGTRARTPEAIRLDPGADGFRAAGQFRRDR